MTTLERWPGWRPSLLIIFAAVATRIVAYGNPIADMDDQFYWLIGRSMIDGQWPIIDIWDRKPIGLFLIYGAIAAIHPSILAVQLAATLFAAATALLIRRAALSIATPGSATLAAIVYLLFLPVFGGQTGQSPVFYNLFVAAAGVLLLRGAEETFPARLTRRAFVSMGLCGVALVIKQTSVAEGMFFGLAYLWLLRGVAVPLPRLALLAAGMITIALLPTAAGFGLFAAKGPAALADYSYAAYASIFAKGATSGDAHLGGIVYLLLFGLPLILAASFARLSSPANDRERRTRRLLVGWILSAAVGYLMIPNFFPHYALPLLVPVSILSAVAFDRPIGKILFAAMVMASLITGNLTNTAANRQAAATLQHVASKIGAARHGGCLYIVNGPVGLYAVVPACRLTRYLFPYHLSLATEATAVGIDQAGEMDRILSRRPAVVVTQDSERKGLKRSVRAVVDARLAKDYRQVMALPSSGNPAIRTLRIWQRRDLPPPPD